MLTIVYLFLAELLSFGHVTVKGIGFSASVMTWVFYALFTAIGAVVLGILVWILGGPKTASRIILSPIGQIVLFALAFMASSWVIEGFWISGWLAALVLGILPGLTVARIFSLAAKVDKVASATWNDYPTSSRVPFPGVQEFFYSGWSDDGSSYQYRSISEGGAVRRSKTFFRRTYPDGRETGYESTRDGDTVNTRWFGENCPQGLEGEKYGPDYFRRYF